GPAVVQPAVGEARQPGHGDRPVEAAHALPRFGGGIRGSLRGSTGGARVARERRVRLPGRGRGRVRLGRCRRLLHAHVERRPIRHHHQLRDEEREQGEDHEQAHRRHVPGAPAGEEVRRQASRHQQVAQGAEHAAVEVPEGLEHVLDRMPQVLHRVARRLPPAVAVGAGEDCAAVRAARRILPHTVVGRGRVGGLEVGRAHGRPRRGGARALRYRTPAAGCPRTGARARVPTSPLPAMTATPTRVRFPGEVRATALLAAPLVLGHLATGLIGFVDSVIAGRHGTQTLAAVSVGAAMFWLPMMIPMGTLMALPPSVSQLDGSGRRDEIAPLFRQALWLALGLGLLLFAFLTVATAALAPMGIAGSIRPGARDFLHGIRWGVPALTLYYCMRYLSDGLRWTLPTMLF